jgi:hypothetical protein
MRAKAAQRQQPGRANRRTRRALARVAIVLTWVCAPAPGRTAPAENPASTRLPGASELSDARARAAADIAAVEELVRAGLLEAAANRLTATALDDAARARLRGQIELASGRPAAAAAAFERALLAAPDDGVLRLYLAQAWVDAGDGERAFAALQGTAALGETNVAQPLLLARAQRLRATPDAAYRTLVAAHRRFAASPLPAIELVDMCRAANLSRAALEWAREAAARGLERDGALAVIDGLIALLGEGAANRPSVTATDRALLAAIERIAATQRKGAAADDPELVLHVAYAYARIGAARAAARAFESAAAAGADAAFAAADQHRVAGAWDRALRWNAAVADPEERRRQRAAILFEAGLWARVVATIALRGDAAAIDVYRLAYAHYALGDGARARALAQRLLSTSMRQQGLALVRATEP